MPTRPRPPRRPFAWQPSDIADAAQEAKLGAPYTRLPPGKAASLKSVTARPKVRRLPRVPA